jgi:hypothetical protein
MNPYLAQVGLLAGLTPDAGPLASGYVPMDASAPASAPIASVPPPMASQMPVPAPEAPATAQPIGPPRPPPGPIIVHDEPVSRITAHDEPVIRAGTGTRVPPPPELPPPGPYDVEARMLTGGGVVPARELPGRGPRAEAEYARGNEAMQAGIAAASDLRQQAYLTEQAAAYDQQQRAHARAAGIEAANVQQAERERQAFDAHKADTDALSRQVRSGGGETGAAVIGGMFGMLLSALPGSLGKAGEMLTRMIDSALDRDLAARKWEHDVGLSRNKAKQTVFDNALRMGGSYEAAQGMYRAAVLDELAAEGRRFAAANKGTEAAAEALELAAKYEKAAADRKAESFVYRQATATGPQWQVSVGGRVLPAPVSGAEANRITLEHAVKPEQRMGEEAFKGQIDIVKEGAKEDRTKASDADKRVFTAPNGQQFLARRPEEAEKMSRAGASVRRIQALTDEAKAVHRQLYTTKDLEVNPIKRAALTQSLDRIEADLVLEEKNASELGVLSKDDIGLAKGVIGKLRSPSTTIAVGAADSYAERANQKYNSALKGLPGLANASGTNDLPPSARPREPGK